MDLIIKIILGVILAVVIGLVIYFGMPDDEPTKKTISYDGRILYKTKNPIFTSNYEDKILYATDVGIKEFDINTLENVILNPIKPIGLAFDTNSGKYIILDPAGRLYNLSSSGVLSELDSGYSALYDTKTGYYLKSGNEFTFIGQRSAKNNGVYGDIRIKLA